MKYDALGITNSVSQSVWSAIHGVDIARVAGAPRHTMEAVCKGKMLPYMYSHASLLACCIEAGCAKKLEVLSDMHPKISGRAGTSMCENDLNITLIDLEVEVKSIHNVRPLLILYTIPCECSQEFSQQAACKHLQYQYNIDIGCTCFECSGGVFTSVASHSLDPS